MAEKQNGMAKSLKYFGIPIIITAIFIIFLLNFLGISVWETAQKWGNKVPVLNMIIPDPDVTKANKAEGGTTESEWEEKYNSSQADLKDKELQLTQLKEQLDNTQKNVNDLKQANHSLEQQVDEKQEKKAQEQLKQIANIYANITPSKAAAMFETMSIEDASITLSQLPQNLQSSILGSMKDAKKAAQMTMVLKEMAGLDELDSSALKAQVSEIVQGQQTPTDTLAETIAGMPAAQSAQIIHTMMGTNEQVAINLLKSVNTSSRSQILTVIAQNDANLAAKITASLN
ncbi:MotE family protein [Neobacillus jeddahensis]|uniref:MotE family protein n=1 Tax=Neobacillus jeddahensis TaxID=1461580 RepID=UPI00058C0F6B|nr:hypothetical protein [Neobacillus jeddahensis]